MNQKLWLACGVLALGAVAVVLAQGTGQAETARGDAPKVVSHVTYEQVSFDAMAATAQGVYAGTIADVSRTKWNQDSGEYWEETLTDAQGLETIEAALPYYEVTLDVERPIVDEVGAVADAAGGQRRMVFTVVGMSPADEIDAAREALGIGTGEDHAHIAAGQPAVVFAKTSTIAWRGGSRTVLQLIGDPRQSIVPVAIDGEVATDGESGAPATLDALVEQVQVIRQGGGVD